MTKRLLLFLTLVLTLLCNRAYGSVNLFSESLITPLEDGDVNHASIKNGKVTYDATKKVLTLDNVKIENLTISINSDEDQFTINLIGENLITNVKGECIDSNNSSLLITSSCGGSLKMHSVNRGLEMSYSNNAILKIENCSVEIEAELPILGFYNGANTAGLNLIIDGANLSLHSNYIGAGHAYPLAGIKIITLYNCVLATQDFYLKNGDGYPYFTDKQGNEHRYEYDVIIKAIHDKPTYIEINSIYYHLEGNEASVTSGSNKYTGNVNIPETVTYNDKTYTVTSIEKDAFKDCLNLTSITMPHSMKGIEDYAFDGCKGLKSVTIPNSVTDVTELSFYGIGLLDSVKVACKDVEDFANYVQRTDIGKVFHGGWLSGRETFIFIAEKEQKQIEIPTTVTSIGEQAFAYCNYLDYVQIPTTVTNISTRAFFHCIYEA